MAKPLVPWMGGKTRLAKKIIPLFPEHTCYVEPFSGAGGIFFKKDPSEAEVLNDIDGDMVNLYRVVQHHLEEFVKQFKWSLISRQMYEWLNMTAVDPLTDIQRAARFYYLQKMAFGGKTHGRTYGIATTTLPKFNLLRIEEELSAVHLRLARVNIENLDWQTCIKKYDRKHTLFYCDPPYWKTAGYATAFEFDQYEKMAELARSIKGSMVISINDHPDIREVFKDLAVHEFAINYQIDNTTKKKRATELVFVGRQE